ncbi:MAG: SDR family NAD(P)-dependent oxidoreductase [Tissierellia bacterium]|nr:SDR family NAD(P)-dependent oxidoreductase [Tissierellia bacterium]
MDKVVVITGASKGIGRSTSEKFRKEGYKVYDLSRSGETDNISEHIHCDVSDFEQVDNAIKYVIEKEKKIDIAISNAGFGISGSVESTDYDKIKKQIDVNFNGAAYFARAVLPYIRESKGRILFLSSVAGQIPLPFQSMYSATKAAILSLAMSLDNEIKISGARALALMPGDLSTNFTASRLKNLYEPDFYRDRVERSVSKMEKDEKSGKSPDYIANKLYILATKSNPKVAVSAGIFYKFALLLVKLLPVRIFNNIIGKIYSK